MSALKTQILTPNGKIYEGDVEGIQLPGQLGSFEVKKNHANLISLLEIGPLRVTEQAGKEQHFAVSGGFVEVDSNNVTVMAEAAEHKDKIDVDRAREAEERARKKLEDRVKGQEAKNAEYALKRAINRLKLADIR